MRATRLLFLGLAAFVLVVPAGCEVGVGRCQPPRPAPKARDRQKARRMVPVQPGVGEALAQAVPKEGMPDAAAFKAAFEWDVKGWGPTQEEAEQDALKKARQLVADHLRRQERPLTWTPSTTYVRTHLVTGPATRHKDDDQRVAGIQTECWALPVKLTAAAYQEMRKLDRAYHARQRQAERERRSQHRIVLAAKVIGGLLLGLVVLGGYLRLDDRAGGAYTRRLRAGLGRVLSAPGAGLRSVAGNRRPQA